MKPLSARKLPAVPAVLASDRGRVVGATDGEGASFVPVRRGLVAAIPDALDAHARGRAVHMARCVAVSRATRSAHALSRLSAAVMIGLYVWSVPDRPDVTGPDDREQGRHLDHDRHVAELPDDDVVIINGVPVTNLERTAVDCARFEHPRDALVVADDVLAVLANADRREPDRTNRSAEQVRARLIARVEALPAGSRGRRQARAVLTWASPWSESPWESHVRWIVLCWGRRDVVLQCRIDTGFGTYYSDLALPDGTRADGTIRYVHIEFDGRVKYSRGSAAASGKVVVDERNRERAIEESGDAVVRLVAGEAAQSQVVVAKIQKAMRTAGPRLLPVRELGR